MAKIDLALVNGKFGFEAKDSDNHIVKIDSKPEIGGENYGTRPMLLLLDALAGCSSVDVLNILYKQKQDIQSYHVSIDGQRGEGGDLSLWEKIHITFSFKGNVDQAKAEKAVQLSLEKYCSVAATLVKAGAAIIPQVIVEHN